MDLTANWLRRLQVTAKSADSREAQSQLSSILDYYNKNTNTAAGKPIDWDGHRANIHTPHVVDKIQAKYDSFMQSEYAVASAVSRCGHSTEKMQALDVAMQYNFMLYFVHYTGHLDQIETMRNVGDITKLSWLEMMKHSPGFDTLQSATQEIGDLSPDDYVEDGLYTRLCTQFSWGTRYIPPFVHSNDAINSVAATLGKFGN